MVKIADDGSTVQRVQTAGMPLPDLVAHPTFSIRARCTFRAYSVDLEWVDLMLCETIQWIELMLPVGQVA